jgi:hypothetical protein
MMTHGYRSAKRPHKTYPVLTEEERHEVFSQVLADLKKLPEKKPCPECQVEKTP